MNRALMGFQHHISTLLITRSAHNQPTRTTIGQSRFFIASPTQSSPSLLNITFNNRRQGKESKENKFQHHAFVFDLPEHHDFTKRTTSYQNRVLYPPVLKSSFDAPVWFRLPRKPKPVTAQFIQHLADIVKRDSKAPPDNRIDLVRFSFPSDELLPSTKIWRVLDGLRPRHLEIIPPINLSGLLDNMHTPWPLQTVLINGSDTSFEGQATGMKRTIPLAFNGVQDLILYDCPGLRLVPPASGRGLVNLKGLNIDGTNAMDSFIQISHANKGLFNSLETLVFLSSSNEMDHQHLYSLQDFSETLQKYTRLEVLNLNMCIEDIKSRYHPIDYYPLPEYLLIGERLGDVYFPERNSYLSLQSCLPSSLKYFSFSAPFDEVMLDDMDIWMRFAEDGSWLPQLTHLSFELYSPDPYERPEQAVIDILIQKRQEFLNIFLTSHPNVEVK